MEVIVEIGDKMEAVQYLRPLLTNQHQNFAMLALFGHTLKVSED